MKSRMISLISLVGILVAFQNCSVANEQDGTMDAASCLQNSVLNAAFPQGKTVALPVGQVNTPTTCLNHSPFNQLTFDPRTQTLILSGNSGQETFDLISGGAGCSGKIQFGGDTWGGRNAIQLQTELSPLSNQGKRTLKIASDANLNCIVEL